MTLKIKNNLVNSKIMCNFAAVFEKQSDCEDLRAVYVAKRSSSHKVLHTKFLTRSFLHEVKYTKLYRYEKD